MILNPFLDFVQSHLKEMRYKVDTIITQLLHGRGHQEHALMRIILLTRQGKYFQFDI